MSNFNDLDPDTPEYEAALMAAQEAEDEANGNVEEPEGEAEPQPEAQAAPEPEAKEVAVEAEEDEPAKPAGVASKDGTRVLPYAALKAERRAARQAANRAEKAEREAKELREQIEAIRAGKAPAKDETDIDDAELAELEQDFPQVAKVAKLAREAKQELARIKAQQKPEPEPEDDGDDPVQDAIDTVPLLSEWQASDREKFARAIELDNAIRTSRKWVDKPLHARFAHVAKLVADEYDLEVEEPAPAPQARKPAPSKADPKAVIERAKRANPNTLSDLKGGDADPTDERIESMSPTRMLARFASMTDEQIDAHLAKLG